MRIAVTGGIGSIGRTTVAQLLLHGHSVLVLDRVSENDITPEVAEEIRGAEYRQVDITNFEGLKGVFDGLDAVVHLAALAAPSMGPEHVIFDINCRGSFNIYRTAADAGIKRVVSASSINALGFNYGIKSFPIRYFPIDEEHPDYTTDPYSFSKRALEETAAYFWRREGISGVSLRFPGVYNLSGERGSWWVKGAARRREALTVLHQLPEEERRARLAAAVERQESMRGERLKEQPWELQRERWEKMRHEGPPPPEVMLCFGREDFWASINVLDAAQAIEKGVTAEYEGSHPLFVNDSHNSVGVDSELLVAYCFPEVTTWKRRVVGSETLVSYDRARALIGFEPEHLISRWSAEAG